MWDQAYESLIDLAMFDRLPINNYNRQTQSKPGTGDMHLTLVASIKQCCLCQFEASDDRRMRNHKAVIPHDCKAEAFPISVFDKIIPIIVPGFSHSQGILRPRSHVDYSLHESFHPTQATGHRS